MIEMRVARLGVDSVASTYVLVLRELHGTRVLPIWIGQPEAEAIVMELQSVTRDRPLTHDLIKQVILGLGATVRRVVISRVEHGTYFAELQLQHGESIISIDARPSDSVAIALRTGAAIFAADDLLIVHDGDEQSIVPPPIPGGDRSTGMDMSPDELKAYLQRLRPEDLGKFMP
ncbi:MAG: bifunctional nuclease family protein [Gemmatimonadaceae bacterium]|nr:bifunctional nuclease family protein [Gemmatimonadaceae bacterium]